MRAMQRLWKLIILVSLCHLCECAIYKKLSQENRNSRIQNGPESLKLVRINLAKNNELDSLQALSRSHIGLQKRGEPTKPLALNSLLIGSVGIGTPVQEFKFHFDTMFSNMWVPSLNCRNCGDKKRYNSSASSTYILDGTVIYPGMDSGFGSIDQVSFGDVVIKNQSFVEMTELNELDTLETTTAYDGVFCLGFDNGAQHDVLTPLREMFNQKLIEKEVFSIYQNSTGGEILFGGYDRDHIEQDINWVPIADQFVWSFMMDSISLKASSGVQELTVCKNGCKFVVNTHYPYIAGPPDEIIAINEAMGAKPAKIDGSIYTLPDCDLSKLPNLVLKIGENYVLTPEQYIQRVKVDDQVICISSLHAVELTTDDMWIFGGSVVGQIYTIFDYQKKLLGFARSK